MKEAGIYIIMKDFPTCFGENVVQVADASCSSAPRVAHNMVTCIYQCILLGQCCLITMTWSKNLIGQYLSLEIDDSSSKCVCKFDIKPWLFSGRKGFKGLEVNSCKIELYWDFSSAKFGSGSEPLEEYYLAMVSNGEIVLLLGDMKKEAFKKTNASSLNTNAIFISKREHIFGKSVYHSKAQFCDNGQVHDITIECDTNNGSGNLCLVIRVDRKAVVRVKHLRWKFRGNQTILVDGLHVEVSWDVHNWLFGTTSAGNAVFMFQTCLSSEKLWTSQTFSDPFLSPLHYSKNGLREANLQDVGFSLVLYAWKNE